MTKRMRTILAAMLLNGCATAPLTYEQQLAIAQAGAGLQNAGAIIAQSAPPPVVVYPAYNPAYSPQFRPLTPSNLRNGF